MNEWNKNQINKIKRINEWANMEIKKSQAALDKCGDGSYTIDVLEDRVLQLRRIKDSLPKYVLSD